MNGKLLRDVVNLLLYGGAFIGLCAACITAFTFELIGNVADHIDYILLIGVSTSALYAAHRVIGLHRLAHLEANERYAVIRRYKYHIWVYAIAWLALSIFYFLPLASFNFILWLIPGGSIALSYVLPFLKGGKRLRDMGWVKIVMIGWSWAWLTGFLPAYYFMHTPEYLAILIGLERMLFIIAITIPFEIRDMAIDESVGLINMSSKFGLKKSLRIGYVLTGLIVLITLFLGSHYVNLDYSYSMITICILTLLIIRYSHKIKDDYFFSGLTDGLMILTVIFYSVYLYWL